MTIRLIPRPPLSLIHSPLIIAWKQPSSGETIGVVIEPNTPVVVSFFFFHFLPVAGGGTEDECNRQAQGEEREDV